MINITPLTDCKECSHERVCSLKEEYEREMEFLRTRLNFKNDSILVSAKIKCNEFAINN